MVCERGRFHNSHGVPTGLPWATHGASKRFSRCPACPWRLGENFRVLPWRFRGTSMVRSWYFNRASMILPYNLRGAFVVLPWWFSGTALVLSINFHGAGVVFPMVLPWCSYGAFRVLPWLFHGPSWSSLSRSWCSSGFYREYAWCFHEIAMAAPSKTPQGTAPILNKIMLKMQLSTNRNITGEDGGATRRGLTYADAPESAQARSETSAFTERVGVGASMGGARDVRPPSRDK